jgi:hypothetical protein
VAAACFLGARVVDLHQGVGQLAAQAGRAPPLRDNPRIEEGDMLSVASLWLDYSALTDKLALLAENDGDPGLAWVLDEHGVSGRCISGRSDACGPDYLGPH